MIDDYPLYSWQYDDKEKIAGTEKVKIVPWYNPTVILTLLQNIQSGYYSFVKLLWTNIQVMNTWGSVFIGEIRKFWLASC